MASSPATLSSPSTPLFTLFKTPVFSFTKTPFSTKIPTQTIHSCSISSSPNSSRSLYSISPVSSRLARFVNSAASSNAGEESKSMPISNDSEKLSTLSSDVIVLDVKGMMCEGCAGSVKRMLESQPQVSSASVNLALETATVLPVIETKVTQNWQKELGETLAKHLTNCGFQSNLRENFNGAKSFPSFCTLSLVRLRSRVGEWIKLLRNQGLKGYLARTISCVMVGLRSCGSVVGGFNLGSLS